MIQLKDGTRMIKTRTSQKRGLYELINNRLGIDMYVNKAGAKILRRINNNKIIKNNLFLQELRENGLIIDNEKSHYVYLCDDKKCEYPLSGLNIELTNNCNLKCIHCYGDFGHNFCLNYINYEWIMTNMEVFDSLNVKQVSITGGEATLHPKFNLICEELLKHGYELCVFTNGTNYYAIKSLLENTLEYKYTIKVSLDGFEAEHDYIRGISGTFRKVCSTLDLISKYPNVKLYISTIIMKCNLNRANDFSAWIKEQYPYAIHSSNLIFPTDYCSDLAFTESEFDNVYKKMPHLFKYSILKTNKGENRCTGGISQCTITPDGMLKICNSACDSAFYFKYNVFEKGLDYSWYNCGENIIAIRNEKRYNTEDCKNCKLKKKCYNTDCRIIGKNYAKKDNRSNPITCYITRKGCENNG